MKISETNKDNSLSTILFIVICFLCVSAFSDTRAYNSRDSMHKDLTYEYHVNHLNAVLWNNNPLSSLQKICFFINCNAAHNLFKASFKIANENRQITQIIIQLSEIYLNIKPAIQNRIYNHLIQHDNGEPPFLS